MHKITFTHDAERHTMDDDEIENMFNDDSIDDQKPVPENEHFVNIQLSELLIPNELALWTKWRDEQSYIQTWQDVALNPATGSSFIVHTQ